MFWLLSMVIALNNNVARNQPSRHASIAIGETSAVLWGQAHKKPPCAKMLLSRISA